MYCISPTQSYISGAEAQDLASVAVTALGAIMGKSDGDIIIFLKIMGAFKEILLIGF